MDLDAVGVADEHHGRQSAFGRRFEEFRQVAIIQALGPFAASQAQRLGALRAMLLQQGVEMMGVLQRGPAFAQGGGIDLRIDERRSRCAGFVQRQHGILLGSPQALDQRFPGADVAGLGKEHLVHRHALLVEHLDAALGTPRCLLGNGEDGVPPPQEQAQVDIRRDHQAHLPIGRDRHFAIRPLAFVDAMLVAGQRHDRPQFAERRQQGGPVRPQAHGIDADPAGDQLAFADLQQRGGVARA